MEPEETERERLIQELNRLEQEQRTLDLRDRPAWEAHQREIDVLRRQIAAFQKRHEPSSRGSLR